LGIGAAGAKNAALLAAAMLATTDDALNARLQAFRDDMVTNAKDTPMD
jgi:5-(carboxyamino)imidazole ribonucleotide mutase